MVPLDVVPLDMVPLDMVLLDMVTEAVRGRKAVRRRKAAAAKRTTRHASGIWRCDRNLGFATNSRTRG